MLAWPLHSRARIVSSAQRSGGIARAYSLISAARSGSVYCCLCGSTCNGLGRPTQKPLACGGRISLMPWIVYDRGLPGRAWHRHKTNVTCSVDRICAAEVQAAVHRITSNARAWSTARVRCITLYYNLTIPRMRLNTRKQYHMQRVSAVTRTLSYSYSKGVNVM